MEVFGAYLFLAEDKLWDFSSSLTFQEALEAFTSNEFLCLICNS